MPFQASRALGGRGVYLGREMSGSAFCYDPFELAEQSVLTGPAMIVLGEIGKASPRSSRPTCTARSAYSAGAGS